MAGGGACSGSESAGCRGAASDKRACGATTIFRHFYADDATAEDLVAQTLEFTRHASIIKLTPDPYFMTLTFGGRAAPRSVNDARPALVEPPVSPGPGAWEGFRVRNRAHIELVLRAVRLLKAEPAAAGKRLYVNVFAPFTVAMQCDPRLLERLGDEGERGAVERGLWAIADATADYVSALAEAGADGIFYSNKCMRRELGELVEDWVVPLDAAALRSLRSGRARPLDMVLHACGKNIDFERIVALLGGSSVYPGGTALSWNFEEGNPSLKRVLGATDLRVWGTYPRRLLTEASDDGAAGALQTALVEQQAWLEDEGYLDRVTIGPDCCPGAFAGEEVPAEGWRAVRQAYAQYPCRCEPKASSIAAGAGVAGGA
jgi:hypothetical protein